MKHEVNIDAVLRDWPTAEPVAHDEDARVEAIVRTAIAKSSAQTAEEKDKVLRALDPPELAPEPGEPAAGPSLSGEKKKMSNDPRLATDASAPRKKQSLKEIAERASQAGLGRSSVPPASGRFSTATPIPPPSFSSGPPSSGIPSARSSIIPSSRPSSVATPLASSRSGEPDVHDSGVVDLNRLLSSVTPEQEAAASSAQPATQEIVAEQAAKAKAVVAGVATAKSPASVPAAAAAPSSALRPALPLRGIVVGAVFVALGVAAAFAFMRTSGDSANTPTAVAVAPATPEQKAAPAQASEPAAAPKEEAVALAAPEQPAQAEAPAPAKEARAGAVAKEASPPPGGAVAAAPAMKTGDAPKPADTSAPAAAGSPDDLAQAMAKAAGSAEKSAGAEEKPEPASGGGKSRNSSIAEQPPQGSVQAAIGSVMGAAKACVAGADDVSRAQITFLSSGAVSSVSVSGWASGKSASGCIQSALKGANVGPFSRPSFTVGITIRP